MFLLRRPAKSEFQISCVWCGVRIRKASSEDAHGLCLKCFYRFLNEHLRRQRQARAGEGVSDR